jgi:hypothetical protein
MPAVVGLQYSWHASVYEMLPGFRFSWTLSRAWDDVQTL